MRIVFACDHAGFELKEYLRDFVASLGYEVEDLGAQEYNAGDDYPDYVSLAAQAVSQDPENTKAILLGGSGQGEAIVANRYKNVRAVVFVGEPLQQKVPVQDIITLSRKHNNSNALSLGARFLTNTAAEKAVQKWLTTTFDGEDRHVRRNTKIDTLT